jgi:hypothetical protein
VSAVFFGCKFGSLDSVQRPSFLSLTRCAVGSDVVPRSYAMSSRLPMRTAYQREESHGVLSGNAVVQIGRSSSECRTTTARVFALSECFSIAIINCVPHASGTE